MDFLIFAILLISLIYIYAYVVQKRKKAEKAEKQKLFFEIESAKNNVKAEMQELFLIPKCTKCDDTIFDFERFNSQYTSIEIKCNTCGKGIWISDNNKSNDNLVVLDENFTQLKDLYINSYGALVHNQIQLESNCTNVKRDIRESIPKSVKQDVWQRDGGKCVDCGSKEKLEYDHIIPISKGGANTVRNIQLLCENCNRTKSAKIM